MNAINTSTALTSCPICGADVLHGSCSYDTTHSVWLEPPVMCDTCGEMTSDGQWCCSCGAIQGAPRNPGVPPVESVILGNPCGTTGTGHCFDCQQCQPGQESDEAFVLVRYLGERLHTHSIVGPEAERLIKEFKLLPEKKEAEDEPCPYCNGFGSMSAPNDPCPRCGTVGWYE